MTIDMKTCYTICICHFSLYNNRNEKMLYYLYMGQIVTTNIYLEQSHIQTYV